jgi:hypothetical protein
MLPLIIGIVLALVIGLFATRTGLDRDRAFYPTVMIVIALYYVLFAVMAAPAHVLLLELLVCALFTVAATFGFKRSLWIVVAALGSHGLMDLVHGNFIANPGVPSWWPGWCCAYDVSAAAYLAWLLKSGRVRAAA